MNDELNEGPERNRQQESRSLKWYGEKRFWLLKWSGFQITGVVSIILVLIYGCIEPFSPPEVNSPDSYLVVDGFLNAGNDTSRIQLSYTKNTNDQSAIMFETGAEISVAAENGETYAFTETKGGTYILPPVNLNNAAKYHLNIKTKGGKEYLSEDVPVIITPAIDSVTYQRDLVQDAMVIKVNTHDPANNTRFYKWKFEETYQYRSAYYSGLIINPEKKEIISRQENINLCWQTVNSTNIMLGSTIKLSNDVIKDLPLNIVPVNTNKFYIKYSILVKQYALSQAGFEYWTDLAKTTQGTGSLFDPQPSQVTGNIRNTANPRELVFGYFSASTVTTKRIFIRPNLGSIPRCDAPDTLTINEALNSGNGLLLNYSGNRSEFVLSTSHSCADCRVQGGTTIKPSFWED